MWKNNWETKRKQERNEHIGRIEENMTLHVVREETPNGRDV